MSEEEEEKKVEEELRKLDIFILYHLLSKEKITLS